jgi:branched-chain amino acid transport system permease protein
MSVRLPVFFGLPLNTDRRYYFLVYALVIAATLFTKNLTRSRSGRAFVAIRDRYLSAEVMGVNVWGYRILSFGVSSFMVGVAGSLWAHYVMVISDEHFTIGLSVHTWRASSPRSQRDRRDLRGDLHDAAARALRIRARPRTSGRTRSDRQPVAQGTFGCSSLFIIRARRLAHRWNKIKAYRKLWPFRTERGL